MEMGKRPEPAGGAELDGRFAVDLCDGIYRCCGPSSSSYGRHGYAAGATCRVPRKASTCPRSTKTMPVRTWPSSVRMLIGGCGQSASPTSSINCPSRGATRGQTKSMMAMSVSPSAVLSGPAKARVPQQSEIRRRRRRHRDGPNRSKRRGRRTTGMREWGCSWERSPGGEGLHDSYSASAIEIAADSSAACRRVSPCFTQRHLRSYAPPIRHRATHRRQCRGSPGPHARACRRSALQCAP
jgi:hypothetical protein